jgi:hypothetical protein
MNGVCATDSEVSNPSFKEPREIATRLVKKSNDGVGAIGAARHIAHRTRYHPVGHSEIVSAPPLLYGAM